MEESYEDPIVIELVNEKFIPIKVDTDKRPDINERYNQDGWPTTAFLTPDGMIIAGATYLPASQLAIMLEQVYNYFQRSDLQFEIQKPAVEKGEVKPVASEIFDEALMSFDISYGGFGSEPKFPLPDVIELALLKFKQTGDNATLLVATKTLDGIMGIFDSIEGGFYRYSVTREWNLPHYEKMLETNAQLISAYIHAYRLNGEEKYRITAERTADFLLNVLHGSDGFFGSQDADKEEEYYGKPLEERRAMPQPFIDRNVYVSLNALAISAFLELGGRYAEIAIETTENLLNKCFSEDGMCHYFDGKPNVYGLLSDNINFVKCLMDAYEKTGDGSYIDKARHLMDLAIERFFDAGFKDRAGDGIGLLSAENRNVIENSFAAECLVRLAFYTGQTQYRELAEKTLAIFAKDYGRYRLHAAAYAIAAERFLGAIEITLKNKDLGGIPYDRRIAVKFDANQEPNIIMCMNSKCLTFNSIEEARKAL